MLDNQPPTPTSDAGSMQIVPSPVIVFTKADAVRAARLAPVKNMPDHENACIVASMVTAEGIIARQATLIVTHHAQSHRTKKSRVMNSWQIAGIPVLPTNEPHVYNLAWPPEAPVVFDQTAEALT